MSPLNENLENVNCVLCGADDTEMLREIPPWACAKYRKCGLVYVNPRSREQAVQKVYEKNSFMSWFKKKTYERRKMADLKNISERLRRGETLMTEVAQYKRGGRLLDIGCNRGFIIPMPRHWDGRHTASRLYHGRQSWSNGNSR